MIAYNSLWLHNLFIREQAAVAFHQNCLDKEECELINSKYPVHFYTPNLFIRIGLFILTTVILIFSFGLLALLFLDSLDKIVGGMAIFFAFLSYAALEYMVQAKNHLQSGADDALLWISACSLFGGTSYLTNAGDLANCIIIFIIALYSTLRFADRVMGAVLYISLLGIFFFVCTRFGPLGKAIVPFVIMAISAIIYLLVNKAKRLKVNQLYSNCLVVVSLAALLSFYFSGNYYVVRELSNTVFNLNLAQNESIPFGWLFWIFTVVIPLFYLVKGIQKKDIVMIRVALLLVAAIIFTVHYYYTVASIEAIMTTAGVLLMVVSYGLTRYLDTPKYGFTILEIAPQDATGKLQIESLLQVQSLTGKSAGSDGNNFGGGSFGGGGASGEF
ncbi:MAG: hypothetical protein H7Z13_05555 [Ferruginibacter sp.]|nr:hypothetical protein [Ferruginibacter sp.]